MGQSNGRSLRKDRQWPREPEGGPLIANPTSSRRSAVSNSKKYAMTEKGDPVFFYPRRACCENLVKRGICMVWHELGCLQELGRLLALLRSGDADAPRCPDGAVEDNGLLGVTDHRVWLSPNAATSRTGSLRRVLRIEGGGHPCNSSVRQQSRCGAP